MNTIRYGTVSRTVLNTYLISTCHVGYRINTVRVVPYRIEYRAVLIPYRSGKTYKVRKLLHTLLQPRDAGMGYDVM